jgi:hypothetical protein
VCGWINAKATVPVWAKMTPNVTDITWPARTALTAGAALSVSHDCLFLYIRTDAWLQAAQSLEPAKFQV